MHVSAQEYFNNPEINLCRVSKICHVNDCGNEGYDIGILKLDGFTLVNCFDSARIMVAPLAKSMNQGRVFL